MKVVVIGLDAPTIGAIQRCVKEGKMPNTKRLIEEGVWGENCLVPHPTITPPNWTTVATGSWIGTHGIVCFHNLEEGKDPTYENAYQNFDSRRVQAEFIWETAEKVGKRSIILNYPTSWPPRMREGIQIGGVGVHIGDWRMDKKGKLLRGFNYLCNLSDHQLFTNEELPLVDKIDFKPAKAWRDIELGGDELEAEIKLGGRNSLYSMHPNNYYLLLRKDKENYKIVELYKEKNKKGLLFSISVGEWSKKIKDVFNTEKGKKEGTFMAKLLEVSPDASKFRLYFPGIISFEESFYPEGIGKELENLEGFPSTFMGDLLNLEWGREEDYVERVNLENIWLGEVAYYLLKNKKWDLFFMHAHAPDHTYHTVYPRLDTEDKKSIEWAQKIEDGIYHSLDQMIGRILDAIDKKETVVIIVSDHGATPTEKITADKELWHSVDEILEKKSLLVFKEENGERKIDLGKSKAVPSLSVYINVNLKDRYPSGIVERKDYEKVRDEIIDTLYEYRDPKTGKKPIVFALKREDARIIGLYGEKIGDIIYGIKPEFFGEHGRQITTGGYSIGSIKGVFIITGPNLKKGVKIERTIWLTDIVPTICYTMDLPFPKSCEGAILWQIFEDPDFKIKEKKILEKNYERVQNALRGMRSLTHSYGS